MIYQPSVFLGWQPGETFCVARWGLGIGDHICFGKMLDENTTDLSKLLIEEIRLTTCDI